MKKLSVVFFGTPDFSVASLELLHHHPLIDLKLIVSMPDRPAGRGMELKSPEVIEYAKKNKLPFIQTESINKDEEFKKIYQALEIDFCLVIAFAQFLGESVLAKPRLGCFNIHTSLLPKYRGAAPIQYALLNGDTFTGVSIQKMVKKMDAGDIAHLHEVAIDPNETSGLLFTRLKFQAALALNDFISKLHKNKISYQAQDESNVSFAPVIKKEDGQLKFAEETSEQIINKIRAFDPWPGTFCFLNDKRMKVIRAEIYHRKLNPGESQNDLGSLVVGTKNGSLRLSWIQLEGKKACSDKELLNGLKSDIKLT